MCSAAAVYLLKHMIATAMQHVAFFFIRKRPPRIPLTCWNSYDQVITGHRFAKKVVSHDLFSHGSHGHLTDLTWRWVCTLDPWMITEAEAIFWVGLR